MAAEASPTSRLFLSDERIAGFTAAFAYHASVKPSHDADSRLALNESAASTRIGA
jgi:hypothetical protein